MDTNKYLINNTLALQGILSEMDACGVNTIGLYFSRNPQNHIEIHAKNSDACRNWMRLKGAETTLFDNDIYPYQAVVEYPNNISVFCLLTEEEKQEWEENHDAN